MDPTLLPWRCFSLLLLILIFSDVAGQRGRIIRAATTTILDPNRDGYVSRTTSGFSNDGYYVDEFELRMFPMPKLGGDVPGDNTGKSCGITDLIPDNKGAAVYAVRDAANNLIFRFRVGDDNPSVEAWTILLDTDGKMGASDPNATDENPGFEIDITLIKRDNSGVLVYDIDGIDNCPSDILFYDIDSHFQISIGDEVSCGDPDYFYDFYVPFSEIATAFGINVNTGLRYVAVTNVSATCAMGGNISDIAGVDNTDDKYRGCDACAFLDLINNQCPTAPIDLCEDCAGFEKDRVSAPIINEPIRAGQTRLTGSTVESNIYIRLQVYTNTAPSGSPPAWGTVPRVEKGVYTVGTLWTVDLDDPLLAYDKVVAIAQKDEFTVPCGADGGNTTSTSVTVVEPNTPPVANNQTIAGVEDTPSAITLTASDAENDPLTYTIVTLPSNGTLTGAPPSVTYTPLLNFNGQDSFTFQVSDGIYSSVLAGVITINVAPVNDKPVANNLNLSTAEDTPVAVTLTASDVDGNSLVYTVITPPAQGSLSGVAPNLTFTPAANYFGSDSFTFRVNDGTENSNTATVSISITPVGGDVPVANPQNVTTPEDVAIAITLTGSDPDLDPLTFAIVTAPANGTLTGTAPNVTYRPNTNFFGSDSFTFRVNDGSANSAPATVSITVTPVDDTPVANNQSLTTAEDTPVSFTLSVTNPDNDPLVYIIVSGPANGVLSGTAPSLTYTPATNYHGQDSFTFRVNNGSVDSNVATVSITVTPVGGDAPVANPQNVTTPEDTPLAITLTGSDPDLEPLTYSIVTGPAQGTLTGTAPNVTYRPNSNYAGADSFTFRVNDGTLNSAPATVAITVTPVNDAPVAFSKSVPYDMDTPKAITLTGSDADGDPLAFTVTVQPLNGTLSGTAPNVTYTPDTGFTGDDSFKFIVNDGTVNSNEATIALNLTPVTNVAPVASDDAVSTDEDTSMDIVLNATDANGDNLSFTITQAPLYGTLSGSGVNVTYTPDANYNGADSFIFEASDGTLTSSATVDITVRPVNDAPVANSQSVTTTEDVPVDIMPGGSDVEGSALTVEILAFPGYGTLSITGSVVTYTPDANYHGFDTFTFRVNDGALNSAPATVSITIDPVNDAPVASDQNLTTPEDTSLDITLTATDVDDSITFTVTQSPSNGMLSGSGENLVYLPNEDFYGADSFKFEATDGTLVSNEATVFITVTAVNDAPVGNDQSVTTQENTPKVITLTGSDIEGSPLIFAIAGLPDNGTVMLNGAEVTYSPATDYEGTDSFTFTVSDGDLTSGPATVSILVEPGTGGSPPVAIDETNVTTNEDTALDIDLAPLATDSDGDPITFSIVEPPVRGLATLNGNIVIYVPDANYNGPDSFTFIANDGANDSNTGIVLITVLPVNDPPVVSDDEAITGEDVPVSVTLEANDIDSDTFSYTIIVSAENGILSGTAPNLVYEPNEDFNGTDNFTYRANDGFADSNVGTVTITVTPVNDAPVVSPLTSLPPTREDSVLRVCLNVVDVDGDDIIFNDPVNAAGGGTMVRDVAPFDFCYIFSPSPNYNGESVWSTPVTDENGLSGQSVAEILIFPVNDPPVALDEYTTVSAESTLEVNLVSNDLPIATPFQEFYDIYANDSTDVVTLDEIVNGPFHGTVVVEEDQQTIRYKPESYTFIGGDSIVYRICDTAYPSMCSTATLFIDVTDNNFPFRIYEGVSPNNDGLNDYLHIDGIHRYQKNLVRIFDRFNNLVCEIEDYDNEGRRWTGQSNHGLGGSRLPDGTYFYTIHLAATGKLYSGFVILKEK